MSWTKLDDAMGEHRKIKRALRKSRPAVALHFLGILHCSRYLTDGFVEDEYIDEVLPARERKAALDALVEQGMWTVVDGGYAIHDYLDHNPTAAEVAAGRGVDRFRKELTRDHKLIAAIRARDGNSCRYCQVTVDWRDRRSNVGGTYDHIIPVSQGGQNTFDNVVVCCRGCNQRKGARTPAEAGMVLAGPGPGSSPDLAAITDPRPVPSRPVQSPQPPRGRRQDGIDEKAAALGFDEWLLDHHTVTGKTVPAAGTKTRHTLAGQYVACCNEVPDDPPLPALKLATRAAHADPHRKENGYDGAENVLRPTKILNLVDNGRRMAKGQLGANDKPPTVAQIQAAQQRRSAA